MHLLAALLASTFAATATGLAQLLPAGEFAGRDGRPGGGRKWRVDDAQGRALAAEMNATAARTPIVIDYDHQTLNASANGAKAPAAGWMHGVEWRDGAGLYARVEWTPAAKAHIEAGEYRYISPVIFFDPASLVVKQVAMASLVNHPNLLGMDAAVAALGAFSSTLSTTLNQENHSMELLASLVSLLGLAAGSDATAALAAVKDLQGRLETATAEVSKKATLPAALAAALGLQADAAEVAALSAVEALKAAKPASNAGDAATLAAMTALQTQIAAMQARIDGEALAAAIDKALADGKLLPAQKAWAEALGRADMAQLTAYLASAPVLTGLAGQSGGKPGAEGGAALSADAEALRRGFGLSAEQWAKGVAA